MSAVGDARKRLAETHVHDRMGELDRSICSICDEPFIECTGCGTYGCLCNDDDWWWTAEGRAAKLAEARAEERERVAQAIEARGRVCSDAHGMECIGGVAYRDAAHIARGVPRA